MKIIEIGKPAVSLAISGETMCTRNCSLEAVLKSAKGQEKAHELELTKRFRTVHGKTTLLSSKDQIRKYKGREWGWKERNRCRKLLDRATWLSAMCLQGVAHAFLHERTRHRCPGAGGELWGSLWRQLQLAPAPHHKARLSLSAMGRHSGGKHSETKGRTAPGSECKGQKKCEKQPCKPYRGAWEEGVQAPLQRFPLESPRQAGRKIPRNALAVESPRWDRGTARGQEQQRGAGMGWLQTPTPHPPAPLSKWSPCPYLAPRFFKLLLFFLEFYFPSDPVEKEWQRDWVAI